MKEGLDPTDTRSSWAEEARQTRRWKSVRRLYGAGGRSAILYETMTEAAKEGKKALREAGATGIAVENIA
jgi:hypothetical protein